MGLMNFMRWLPAFRDMDYEQQATVTDCAKPGALLVYGPAGSGKTAITLYCAKTLHDQRRSFKIIVYTNVLLKFITAGASELNLPADSATTLYRWARQMYKDQIGPPPNGSNDIFSLWVDGLIAHWQRHPSLTPRYDYILIDEAQDFKPNVATFLRMMARNIVVAADLSQSLYEDIQDREALRQRWAPLDTIHEVPRNYRNPHRIAALASVFLDPATTNQADFLRRVKGRDGETPPIWSQVSGHKEQIDRICDIIGQARGSVRIGILYRHQNHLEQDQRALMQAGVQVQVALNRDQCSYDFNRPLPVLTTAHSAKGLEFDWVIVPGLDRDKWDGDPQDVKERNLLFVAMTRAKERLYLLSTKGQECGFLHEILVDHGNLIQALGSQVGMRTYAASTQSISHATAINDDDPF